MKNNVLNDNKPKINMFPSIKRYIFWLDINIHNDENQNYLKKLEQIFPIPTYKISTFDSIKSAISHLKGKKKKK